MSTNDINILVELFINENQLAAYWLTNGWLLFKFVSAVIWMVLLK